MRIRSEQNSALEVTALVGIVASMSMMLPAFFMADVAFLAAPALLLLVGSLLYGTR